MKQPHHILAVRIAHPVWTLFLLALALAVDHTGIVRLGLLCSCLHECGHLLVWVLLTRLPPTLIICPTGFCLSLRGVVLTPKQFIHGLDGWQINSNLGILFHFKIQTQKHSCVN